MFSQPSSPTSPKMFRLKKKWYRYLFNLHYVLSIEGGRRQFRILSFIPLRDLTSEVTAPNGSPRQSPVWAWLAWHSSYSGSALSLCAPVYPRARSLKKEAWQGVVSTDGQGISGGKRSVSRAGEHVLKRVNSQVWVSCCHWKSDHSEPWTPFY